MVNKSEEPGTSEAASVAKEATEEPAPPQMRAVVLNSYGGLKGVQLVTNRPQPKSVGDNEILVKSVVR